MLNELFAAFVILAICVVLHTTGMLVCVEWLFRRLELIKKKASLFHHTVLLIGVCVFVMMLHLIAAGIWAMFYWWEGLFPDVETSFYFSLGSYSTIGYGDVVLPQRWRLLGGFEGLSGVLMCGLSTAFVFAIVNVLFQMRVQNQTSDTSS